MSFRLTTQYQDFLK